jgi:hypothetical protein
MSVQVIMETYIFLGGLYHAPTIIGLLSGQRISIQINSIRNKDFVLRLRK